MRENTPQIQTESPKIKKKNKWLGRLGFFIAFFIIGGVVISLFYKDNINVLVVGIDGRRTDTMILINVDTQENTVHAVSIPRDTYFPTEGKNYLGQKKINAIYGFKEGGGPDGVVNAVERLMDIEIDHFVLVNYDGIAAIVDLIGGVEIEVPFRMQYDDIYATPPLHIDFQPGLQTIDGQDAMPYLRFRKSNDGSISEGDVQRIVRQQDFIKTAAKKVISLKLPYLVYKGLDYVETDMPALKGALIATSLIGMSPDNIDTLTLPMASIGRGDDGLSYFFHDEAASKALLDNWPKPEPEEEPETEE